MPDYGHPIRFGTFVTPVNAPPQRPVELAALSEELGFDLVTFQDHPYQPRFHDTWTLLTWVAARTSRIGLAGNVHNLPLRPPAVLARAAASLDLLSGGRVNLGLGTGGFWDAIEAMGGDRLTPGRAVDALDQALDVIRGLWDVTDRTPLRAGGDLRVIHRDEAPTAGLLGGLYQRRHRIHAEHVDSFIGQRAHQPPFAATQVDHAAWRPRLHRGDDRRVRHQPATGDAAFTHGTRPRFGVAVPDAQDRRLAVAHRITPRGWRSGFPRSCRGCR